MGKCLSCLYAYDRERDNDRKCLCSRESDIIRRSLTGKGCQVHIYKIDCKYTQKLCEELTWRYEGDLHELCLKCLKLSHDLLFEDLPLT